MKAALQLEKDGIAAPPVARAVQSATKGVPGR